MKRIMIAVTSIALAGAALAAPANVRAMSVGFYGTAGGGLSDWEGSGQAGFEDRRDTRHSGAGVVLDTDSPLSPVGYRLAIGWERMEHESAAAAPGFTLKGLVIDQDLTVDLVGGPGPLRVWAGPELRIGVLRGSVDGAAGPDEDFLALGIGPVLGFDFAVSPSLAVSWKVGYLVTGYAGDDRSSFNQRDETSLGEGHAYATLALMFRTWGGPGSEGPPAGGMERYPRRW